MTTAKSEFLIGLLHKNGYSGGEAINLWWGESTGENFG